MTNTAPVRRRWAVRLLIAGVMLGLNQAAQADDSAHFVGGKACAGCHAEETARWNESHHAQAMQPATPGTVLGDFADAKLDHFGIATTFFRAGDKFMVRTDGPDGSLHDYEITYTFGVSPLQQYLIAMPGGRLQALGIAWDSRPEAQGGQRWYHLYPDRKLPSGDRLHWSGRDQTWNYQCADCHSTNLHKNYDLTTNTYATTWTDVDVSCEACHGPGAQHVKWAKLPATDSAETEQKGLVVSLKPADAGQWEMNPASGIARRTEPLVSRELDVCAPCHSRRKVIAPAPTLGGAFLDSYLPALLEPGLYQADGQIDGEVFEYGSFVQSRMFHAGVTCSNCHEPHGLKLRAEGNALCAQCHLPAKFDAVEHTHHETGSPGAQCLNCHMPTRTYMVVDERRDHSFRVPRPDLSVAIGTPNACSGCHRDKPAIWASEYVIGWFPRGRQTTPHYATALHAGRSGAVDAERQLDRLILDRTQPAIVRSSALLLLAGVATPASEVAIKAAIADPDPLVRAAVPRALPGAPSHAIVEAMAPLVADPIRAVRVEAARSLARADPDDLTQPQRDALESAYRDLIAAETVDAERPEAHLNIGLLEVRRRRPVAAEAEYNTALRLDPGFVPALANLADLDRMLGRDQQGEALLRKAVAIDPGNADVRHSLGLLLVRQHNYAEALQQLRQAAELAPDDARYAYVYAIALNSTGTSAQAVDLLERTHRQHPAEADVLMGLVSIAQQRGDNASALRYARELAKLYPADLRLRDMIQDLENHLR